jgi:hypothetical protein
VLGQLLIYIEISSETLSFWLLELDYPFDPEYIRYPNFNLRTPLHLLTYVDLLFKLNRYGNQTLYFLI